MHFEKTDKSIIEKNNIATEKKLPIVSIILFLLAMAVGLFGFFSSAEDTKISLITTAAILLIFALARLFKNSTVYKYKPTGEVMESDTIYFEVSQQEFVEQSLRNGEFRKLKEMARNNSTLSLLVELYSTRSDSAGMFRIYTYVPHTYEPIGPMEFYKK